MVCAALVLAACGQDGKAPIADDFSDLASLDQKSDSFSSRWKLLGTLAYGDSKKVTYKNPPRYRAFKLSGQQGDAITIDVTSTVGDAVAWLLDASYNVVAMNDDASAGTSDAHIAQTLPASGAYYVALRDYSLQAHSFTVKLLQECRQSGVCQPAPPDCRTAGCDSGDKCALCWGGWVCIASNSVC
jgi:hypothetical protein